MDFLQVLLKRKNFLDFYNLIPYFQYPHPFIVNTHRTENTLKQKTVFVCIYTEQLVYDTVFEQNYNCTFRIYVRNILYSVVINLKYSIMEVNMIKNYTNLDFIELLSFQQLSFPSVPH